MIPAHSLRMLVLQSTPFCNINCSYCYLPDRQVKRRLSESTLASVIKNLAHDELFSERVTVLWHSGEPLAVGLDFYRRALDIFLTSIPSDVDVTHSILTNGTLISPEWCNFFLENKFQIGVSCDGPEFIHNAQRKTRGGRGTYDQVIRGIRLLQRYKIDFYVLCVLSAMSLRYPDEIVRFAIENSIRELCFNIEETEGVNFSETLSSPEIRDSAFRFFTRVLNYTFRDEKTPWIREFDQMFRRFYRNSEHSLSNHLAEPFKIVTVDVDGAWATFSPELTAVRGLRFGNLAVSPISQHIAESRYSDILFGIQSGVDSCRKHCEYFPVCAGGAPSNKYAESGRFDIAETKSCIANVKALADACMGGIGRYVLNSPKNNAIIH